MSLVCSHTGNVQIEQIGAEVYVIRSGWRKRGLATCLPFKIAADIYEVHPASSSTMAMELLKTRAVSQLASADKAIAAAEQAKARAEELKQKAGAKVAELTTQLDTAKADAKSKLDTAATAEDAAKTDPAPTDDEAKKAAEIAARQAASLTASLRKLQSLNTRAVSQLASAEKAIAAGEAMARAEELKQKAAAGAAELVAQLDTAKADAKSKLAAAAAAKDAANDQTKEAAAAEAAREAKLVLEPVLVYISRATRKLYLRRNAHKPDGGKVFDAIVEVPVTIREPDKPIGTHVFTAMARNETDLRWTAVTIDNGDDAKDALDRITIPQDVLDRIAPTALPLSSIIVSDEPLSRETNYRTKDSSRGAEQPAPGWLPDAPTYRVTLTRQPSVTAPFMRNKRLGRPFLRFLFRAQ